MLRITKILLILSVAMWGLLGALENVLDWAGTTGAIGATVSMSTFEGGAESWKATSSGAIIIIFTLLIIAGKITAGLLCLAGAWQMWAVRMGQAAVFQHAKSLALAGCGAALFLLFFGWIVAAETWFEMWRSDIFRDVGLQSAFRYGGMIALIALFVGAREE